MKTGEEEAVLIDLGPFDFFERYRELPAQVPITVSVLVQVPVPAERMIAGILYCGEHVHVMLPPETPYGYALALLTQAYAVARAFTVSKGLRFQKADLVQAADEIAVVLGFDLDSAQSLRNSIGAWHDSLRQPAAAPHLH